jgi:hypothetical protein
MQQQQPIPGFTPEMTQEFFANLCGMLPPASTDSPEARNARDQIAIQAVLALHPADAFEANLASDIVAASAQAKHWTRLVMQPGVDAKEAKLYHARLATLLRLEQSLTRMLVVRQDKRDKQEAEMHPSAMARAGFWFRDIQTPEPVPEPPKTAYETMTEAEQYAVNYPRRAALFRAHGGLPPNLTFGAPEPHIVEGIVNGTSPVFLELDQPLPASAE